MQEAIELAEKFHRLYEANAPVYGYKTRPETRNFDPDSPNGKLMIKVCEEIYLDALADKEAALAEKDNKIQRWIRIAGENQKSANLSAKLVDEKDKEIATLKAWKESAIQVMGQWSEVYKALGTPGRLGDSMPEACVKEIATLRAKVERFRIYLSLISDTNQGILGDTAREALKEANDGQV